AHRQLPRCGKARGIKYRGATLLAEKILELLESVRVFGINCKVSTQCQRLRRSISVNLDHGNFRKTTLARHLQSHHADRAGSEKGDRIAYFAAPAYHVHAARIGLY